MTIFLIKGIEDVVLSKRYHQSSNKKMVFYSKVRLTQVCTLVLNFWSNERMILNIREQRLV